MLYIHMDTVPSLGAAKLFTLAEENHYDDRSCHTCIFPPTMTNLAAEHKSQWRGKLYGRHLWDLTP